MKLIHHVKKHGKTITLHLKKHHKKYIFGILSATLLWKGVSLIAAYALVHNLSFSFADIINNEGEYKKIIETEVTGEETEVTGEEAEVTGEEAEVTGEETEVTGEEAEITETEMTEEKTAIEEECDNNEENAEDIIQENTEKIVNDIIEDNTKNEESEKTEDEINNLEQNDEEDTKEDTKEEPNGNNKENTNDEQNPDNGNGICDEGDIIITNPKEGDKIGKTFDISREFINNDCTNNKYIIKLRDQNDQYLNIFTGDTQKTGFSFDSTQLISEFYTITGTNESGEVIILHEGKYAGNPTNYFSGHKLAIVSDEGETIYRKEEGGEFTIDNKEPKISNINVEYSTKNKKLNIGDTITISFESDEELKNITVNILGQNALLEDKDGNEYIYSMDFSEKNTLGKVVYGIEFEDEIGNTGYIEGYENIELDYTKPTISNLLFSLIGEGRIKITFDTNKKTNANLIYKAKDTNTINSMDSKGKNKHRIAIENIKQSDQYDYSISIQDEAENEIYIGGNFYISGKEVIFTEKAIEKSELLTNIGFTGDKENINMFNNNFDNCTKNIITKDLKLVVNKQKNVTVKIPEFKNSSINKLTNAFIAVLFERIENKELPQYALDEITEDLNNFLLIVKLVKDDNNECKQKMTQYYINRFKNTLMTYGIVNK